MNDKSKSGTGSGSGFALIVAFVVVMGVIWLVFGASISTLILVIRKIEAYPIALISDHYQAIVDWIGYNQKAGGKHTATALWRLSWDVLRYWSFIIAVLFLAAAWHVWKCHPITKLRTKHSIDSLRDAIAIKIPFTNPTVGQNLVNKDAKGWEYQLSPGEFAIQHNIISDFYIHREEDTEIEAGMPDIERVEQLNVWVEGGNFHRDKARTVFLAQLGKRWTGLNAMLPYEKALFGVFAAQALAKNKLGLIALEKMARSYPDTDYGEGHKLAEQLLIKHTVQRVIAKHRYVRTVLLGMFDEAHKKGKLTTSFFIWLKPTDRTLFYALNSLAPPGQQVAGSIEAAGVLSHYFAEKMAAAENIKIERNNKILASHNAAYKMRPLYQLDEPYLDQAVIGLHEALMATGEARDDDDEAKATRAALANRMNVAGNDVH